LIADHDRVITRLYAPKTNPLPFAQARAFDYSWYFQRDIDFIIEERRIT